MKANYICHPDFEGIKPINVFHKEMQKAEPPPHPENLENRHILFRKKFTLGSFESAILKITADDYYKLYVNGNFVTLGPASSYHWAYYYNEIDLSGYLREGENTIAVHTYYQGLINRAFITRDGRAMLWCELTLDGECVLVSDRSWRYHDHTGYSECGRIGYDTIIAECYDSGAPEADFYKESFDDSAWGFASIYENADYTLIKQPTKQLSVYDVKPKLLKKSEGRIFADFGQQLVGYPKLRARGQRGECVTVRVAEELTSEGEVRFDMRCNSRCEEKWILSGGDDELMLFDYKGFRYAEILFPSGTEINEVLMTVRHYPYEEKAVYETENESLRSILRLCANTAKYATQENYQDCPTREKGQYLGDVSIAARAQAVLTNNTDMMKKAIRDFCNSSKICPGIMTVSSGSLMQEIADYSLQFPAQAVWVYSMDGDIEFLREVEPYMSAAYEYFRDFMREDALIESVTEKWNIVDWPPNMRDDYDFDIRIPIGAGLHNVINAFWIGFLESLDELYEILGKEGTGITEKAKASFIKQFYSEKTGLFCDTPCSSHSSVHSNLLPLLFDIGTEDAALVDRICSLIEKKGLEAMGVYIAYFALAALARHGRWELAERLTVSDGCWLNMLKEGATTTFEAWGADQKSNCSLCHPWASAPAIIFAKGVRIY